MLPRLLLILGLLLQPVALGGLDRGACAPPAAVVVACCCGPGACCATDVVAACGCTTTPSELPATPAESSGDQSLILLLATAPPAVFAPESTPDAPRLAGVLLARPRSHNETRAILGIWRT